MEKNYSDQRNIEVHLIMECEEDDLSPAQISALEKKEKAFFVSNNMVQVFINNGDVLFENDSTILICLKNTMESSQTLQIMPDNEKLFTDLLKNKYNYCHLKIPTSSFRKTSLGNNGINSVQKVVQIAEGIDHLNNTQSVKEKNYYLIKDKKEELKKNGCQGNYNTGSVNQTLTLVDQSDKSVLSSKLSTTTFSQSCNFSIMPNNHIVVSALPSLNNKTNSISTLKKLYPSLLVTARPNLLIKNVPQRMINEEQLQLDKEVKSILSFSPSKFTEWLLKEGLIRCDQFCRIHKSTENQMKLKLCMVSADKTNLLSRDYVWVSDCCPKKFTPIFKNSIFEGAPFDPTVFLKLLYHWSCQTDPNNVVQWVNVNSSYLRKFYATLRAVCIAAVHEEYKGFMGSLGGNNKMVEVGLLSVGTTSENNRRAVKAWILGAMETETKRLRLQVIEPVYPTDNNSNQFIKLSEPLFSVVNKNSIILTDLSLNKTMLRHMGYNIVFQTPVRITNNEKTCSNDNLMNYLKNCIPRMFQSTLSVLSKEVIQQFLEELIWRERWGQSPFRAFHSIISHMEKQTTIDSGISLSSCLSKIVENPFMNWQYSNWKRNLKILNENELINSKKNNRVKNTLKSVLEKGINDQSTLNQMRSATQNLAANGKVIPDLKKLEYYYYGQLDGNKHLLEQERKCHLGMKCVLCSKLMNTNISMMKHLISHAFCVYKSTITDNKWCKYCLKEFSSDENLKNHVYEKHIATAQSTLRCLICEIYLKFQTKLILHMQCFHNELEMPYECSICKYRSSEHRHVIDHFYEKHNFSEKAQCPLCLKVIALKDNGKKITQNMYFFLNHIKKHTYKKLVKRCNRCVLSFINKGVLEYHQRMYHKSCSEIPNVKRHEGFSTVWMPSPSSGPIDDENYEANKIPEKFNDYFKREDLKLNISINGGTEFLCNECEGYIEEEGHFPGYFSCRLCTYKTCCEKSMVEHIIKFHDTNTSKKIFNIARQTILRKPMRCICGFKSLSGNTLAYHLVQCNKKSAYPWIRSSRKDESSISDTENINSCNQTDNNKDSEHLAQKMDAEKAKMGTTTGKMNNGRLLKGNENAIELSLSFNKKKISSDTTTSQFTCNSNDPLKSDILEDSVNEPPAKRLKLILND